MRNLKRSALWMVMLAMTFLLAACSGNDDRPANRCGTGLTLATVDNTEQCVRLCENETDCDTNQRCTGTPSFCMDITTPPVNHDQPDVGPTPVPDAGPTPVPDAGPTPIPDANGVEDTDPNGDEDAVADAEADADPDADPDAEADAGPDAEADADPDADPDAGPDVEADAGPDACDPVAVCDDYCTKLYSTCMTGQCTGTVTYQTSSGEVTESVTDIAAAYLDVCLNGATDVPTCAAQLADDSVLCEDIADYAAELDDCDVADEFYCGRFAYAGLQNWQDACSCDQPTTLGDSCVADDNCDGGAIIPVCLTETDDAGDPTGFDGGYCSAYGCRPYESGGFFDLSYDARCGDDFDICLPTAGTTLDNPFGYCTKGCSAPTDCPRADYSCLLVERFEDVPYGFCFPACTDDADCTDGRCNADRACEEECDPNDTNSACVYYGGTCVAEGYCVM
ncbi:MAG: hypothetical protein ACNA8W_05115 [Bradymonadaceae bacterium]